MFKNFPSILDISKKAVDSFKRFPLALLASFLTSIIIIILIDNKPTDELFIDRHILEKIGMMAFLSMHLFIAFKILSERLQWNIKKTYGLQILALLLMVMYYFSKPSDLLAIDKDGIQYILFLVCSLFLIAVLPYFKVKTLQGFWQYNKTLFLGYLVAHLYAQVLSLGLIIALAALDNLFNAEIAPQRYAQIAALVSLFFHSWVFLSRLPENLESLDSDSSYPKGLKVFTQYILLPLVCLYLCILYAYGLKILFTWNWPVGWVSNLILWYSVVSILSLLLLYPLQELKENKWIQIFSRWFFRALIPLIFMLFLAIMERISQYGITEPRYLVLVMAVGLAVVVLYFVFSKKKDIRIIPFIIALLAFLSALGPWSASSVSLSSQKSRLENYLVKINLLVDGQLVKPSQKSSFEDNKEMSSIVEYLYNTHGLTAFAGLLNDSIIAENNLDQPEDSSKSVRKGVRYNSSNKLTNLCSLLGFKYESRWSSIESKKYFNLQTSEEKAVQINGYDKLIHLTNSFEDNKMNEYQLDNLICFVDSKRDDGKISISIGTLDSTYDDLGELDLSDTLVAMYSFQSRNIFPIEALTFSMSGNIYDAKIIFNTISGSYKDKAKISNFDAVLLLKKK